MPFPTTVTMRVTEDDLRYVHDKSLTGNPMARALSRSVQRFDGTGVSVASSNAYVRDTVDNKWLKFKLSHNARKYWRNMTSDCPSVEPITFRLKAANEDQ